MTHTFSGLSVPQPVVRGTAALHVGIADGETANDPPMRFGGTAVTPANAWSGGDGGYWDDSRIPIPTSLLQKGTTSRTNTQGAVGDCLAWAYAGLTYKHAPS